MSSMIADVPEPLWPRSARICPECAASETPSTTLTRRSAARRFEGRSIQAKVGVELKGVEDGD